MAQRGVISSVDIASLLEELDEIDELPTVSEPEPEYVLVRNLIPSLVTWRSPKTGEFYQWDGPGLAVKVRKEDVEFLLNHRRKGCCGAPSMPQFELVE